MKAQVKYFRRIVRGGDWLLDPNSVKILLDRVSQLNKEQLGDSFGCVNYYWGFTWEYVAKIHPIAVVMN